MATALRSLHAAVVAAVVAAIFASSVFAQQDESGGLPGVQVTYLDGTLNDAKDVSISGLVIGEDGKPVVGALVHADERKRGGEQLIEMTGEDGRYRFSELPAGRWRVWAEKDGLTRTWDFEHPVILPSLTPTQVDMVLFNPRSLTVQVRNEKGEPVEGAEVVVDREYREDDGAPQPNSRPELATGMTDANGEAVLSGLRRYRVGLAVHHPEYAAWLGGPIAVGVEPIAITLEEGGTIYGRVEFEGRPLAGVDVRVYGAQTSRRDVGGTIVATDAEGRFRGEHLFLGNDEIPHWTQIVTITTKDYISDAYLCDLSRNHPEHEVNVLARRNTDDAFRSATTVHREPDLSSGAAAKSTAEISGVARDSQGKPVAHESIRIQQRADPFGIPQETLRKAAITDEQGAFKVAALPAGEYLITGEVMEDVRPLFTPVVVTLAEGQRQSVELREGGSVISGTFHTPVDILKTPNAEISSRDPDNAWTSAGNHIASVNIDPATGQFAFPGLAAGSYEINVWNLKTQVKVDGENPVTLDLIPPTGGIAGRVDAPANPLASLELTGPVCSWADLRKSTEFSFNHLPAGRYNLAVYFHPLLPSTPWPVEVKEGEITQVEIQPPKDTGSLLVETAASKLRSGEDVPTVIVYALQAAPNGKPLLSPAWFGADSLAPGKAGFPALAPGPVMLIATAQWQDNVLERHVAVIPRVDIRAGKTSVVRMELVPQPAVRIKCITERGGSVTFESVLGLRIRLVKPGEYALESAENESVIDFPGILHLSPGQYRLEGEATGYEAVPVEFTLESGAEPRDATLVFKRMRE